MVSSRPSMTIADWYIDNDVTASGRKPRPDFDRLLADVETGRIKVIAAWALDRLSRNRRDTMRLLDVCQAQRVLIILARGSDMDLSTSAGQMIASILGEVARNELSVLSDRRTRAAQQAAEAGRRWPGPRPFGFEADRVTVRPAEAAALRDAYDALLVGIPISAACRALNAAGMLTPFGRPWCYSPFTAMISNPRYCGLRAYRGDILGRAEWPAIVGEEQWRAVVAIVRDPTRRITRSGAVTLLSGTARCGACDDVMHVGTSSRAYRTYRCARRKGVPGPHVAVRADMVDRFIARLVIARLVRPDARDLLVDDARPDFAVLHSSAATLRARLEEIAVMLAAGEFDRAQAKRATARVRADLAEIDGQMADAGRTRVLGSLIDADDVAGVWEGLGVDRRRPVVAALFDRIVLHSQGQGAKTFDPTRVEVRWAE